MSDGSSMVARSARSAKIHDSGVLKIDRRVCLQGLGDPRSDAAARAALEHGVRHEQHDEPHHDHHT
jgi:hypothetical protein